MKNLVLAVLLLAVSAVASTTTVAQNIIGPNGLPASGTVAIRSTVACRSGSDYVGTKEITVKFVNGVFSVALVPNDACFPSGTSYMVVWKISGDVQPLYQTWYVPTSSSALKVSDVVTSPVPPVTAHVQWNQLNGDYSNGKYCVGVTGGKVSGLQTCDASSSGGSGGISPTLTWAQIEAGTFTSGSVSASMTWAQIEGQ